MNRAASRPSRCLIMMLAALAGFTCMGGGAARAARTDGAATQSVPRLAGVWEWTDELNCHESYEYHDDGTGVVSSGGEQSEMIYTIAILPLEGGFFQMNATITHNSGGTDCLGGNEDDAGETYTVYVKFLPDEQSHIVCYQPNLSQCFGPLYRGEPGRH